MGLYINPEIITKEEWLLSNGDPVGLPSWPPPEDKCLVCLVDNGVFTAAGVAYSQREFDAFNQPDDSRPKRWYLVATDRVREVVGDKAFNNYFKEKP